VALEIAVRVLYTPPSAVLARLGDYEAISDHSEPEIWLLGTCLPEQTIQADALTPVVGRKVWSLAAAATTPREWLLLVRHHRPARLDAIVIPYGQRDLTNEMSPWESQVMTLATWGDLPDLVSWSCHDTACALEMSLRKASVAYRERGWLANAFWHLLRTRAPIPGSVLSPGAVAPTDRDLPGPGAQVGWTAPRVEVSQTDPSRLGMLASLLDTTRDLGIPTFFFPLPTRALVQSGAQGDPAYRAVVENTIRAGGGQILETTAPGLSPDLFLDDVHLTPEGSRLVTLALAQALAPALSPAPP